MNAFQMKRESNDDVCLVQALANHYQVSFEVMLESQRKCIAEARNAKNVADAAAAAQKKMRDQCVYFCYQDLSDDVYKHTNGEMIHGWYRIVKTDTCYEFTLIETDMKHLLWQKAMKGKHVTQFPLDIHMGVGSFMDVMPGKIHLS